MPYDFATDSGGDVSRREVSFLDVLTILWRRRWTIVLSALIVIGLGGVYYLRTPPRYQSKAQILLIKKEARRAGAELAASMGYQETLSTQMLLLRSPEIVHRALVTNRKEFQGYFDSKKEPDALGKLIDQTRNILRSLRKDPSSGSVATAYDPAVFEIIDGRLSVAAAGETFLKEPNIIEVVYTGRDPIECQRVLSALIESYQDYLGQTYHAFGKETYQLISTAKDDLFRQLTELKAEYQRFRLASPLLQGASADGKTAQNLHEIRMVDIENARSRLLLRLAEQQARLAAIESMLEQKNRGAIAAMIDQWQFDERSRDLRHELERQRVDALVALESLQGRHGPGHPEVVAARARLDLLEGRLANRLDHDDTAPLIDLDARIEAIRQEIDANHEQLAEYTRLFEIEREGSRKLLEFQIRDEDYQKQVALLQALFDDAVGKLEETSLLKDYSGLSTHVIASPEIGKQIAPAGTMIASIAIFAGGILGIVLALISESLDWRFRSPDDVAESLRVPVVGHIGEFHKAWALRWNRMLRHGRPTIAPDVVSHHNPRGIPAESIRAIRTVLLSRIGEDSMKVIQFTSATPGEGVATVICNLAVSLAQAGVKTLVVDADCRSPKIHRLFGVSGDAGISSLLSDPSVAVAEAIQRTTVENLSVLPAGPSTAHPADLLTTDRLPELMKLLRGQYDLVLVRTPAALTFTDAFSVAKVSDGIVYVMRLGRKARHAALQTLRGLEAIGGRIVGVVVNRLNTLALQHYSLESHTTTPGRIAYGYSHLYSAARGRGMESYYLDKRHPSVPPPMATPHAGAEVAESAKRVVERGDPRDS